MIRSDTMTDQASRGKPRASGDDPAQSGPLILSHRVNPARAGMIPPRPHGRRVGRGKPRASGDDPVRAAAATVVA